MTHQAIPEDFSLALGLPAYPSTDHQSPLEDSQAIRQSRYDQVDAGSDAPPSVHGDENKALKGAGDLEDIPGSASASEPHGPALLPPEQFRFSAFSPSLFDNSARTSLVTGLGASPNPSKPLLPSENASAAILDEKAATSQEQVAGISDASARHSRRRRVWIILGCALALLIVVLAVVLPVVFLVVKKDNNSPSGNSTTGHDGGGGGGGKGPNPESPPGVTTGGNGSEIIAADGTTFTYINNFGGYWVFDPKDPYNAGARPQSFSPALNETWDFTQNQIRGVNLGGWLVLEPFISPALFEKYQGLPASTYLPGGNVVDEWTLSVAMINDTSPGGGLSQLEDHYRTFITEQDFAQIAGAGLNWVRLPLPYWAIQTWDGEPFLASVAWKYALLAFQWARKYGIRVFLEIHTAPGSQNGYNHSGRSGTINFLNGPMGVANADRLMGYIRVVTEFISQKEYQDVVQMFGVVNEPLLGIIGRDQLTRFYLQAHDMIREITGIGNGAYIVVHDGFAGLVSWKDFLPGSDRIVLDTHPYVAFGGGLNQPVNYWPPAACRAFQVNQSLTDFGVTVTGEFSGAINDCGLWVKGVGSTPSFGDCTAWDDWANWTPDMKNGIKSFVMASMDAMHFPGYFFWTWKIGNSSVTGKVQAPFWSYQLGLENGWIPADPRDAIGICDTLGVTFNQPFTTQFQPWQTGGAGAGTIAATALAEFSQYPPPAISNAGGVDPTQLPRYTDTASIPTLSTASFPSATSLAGNGWANAQDTMGVAAPIQGCTYPDAWFPPAASPFVCNTAGAAPAAATPPPVARRRPSY